MCKAKAYDVIEQDVLVKISGNGNQSAIGQSRAVTVLDWTKAPNSYIYFTRKVERQFVKE